MTANGLSFGTSGLRGLVSELTDARCAAYVAAFLQHLCEAGALERGAAVLVGRDLRPSSPRLARAALEAAGAAGFAALDCGAVPTPALALAAQSRRAAAIMVTGSHIPADRNGLKFYRPDGEITKADETGIVARLAAAPLLPSAAETVHAAATDVLAPYRRRALDFFPARALAGLRVGVYQHSSVARDLLVDLVEALGGVAIPLGRADSFIPLDTEALPPDLLMLAPKWAGEHRLDALVSTDGDADRPLLADEGGRFLRGDIVGALTARYLGAATVVTPLNALSTLDSLFPRVVRTRIGSPHVIAAMAEADPAAAVVVGFEANGGVLLGSPIQDEGRRLTALPTRDAVLPILAVLTERVAQRMPLSEIVATLGSRQGLSGRLAEIEPDRMAALLASLTDPGFSSTFLGYAGRIGTLDRTDGLRFGLVSGEIVHFRASGNAPELRCYVEADTPERAAALLAGSLDAAARHLLKAGAIAHSPSINHGGPV